MSVTFFNVTEDIIKDIDFEVSSYYFTKEDYDLEMSVLEIESSHFEQSEEDYILYLAMSKDKYTKICNTNELESMTFKKILKIKDSAFFEKIIFEKKEARKDIGDIDKIKYNIIDSKKYNSVLSVRFEHHESLYDVRIILQIIFDKVGIYFNRFITIYEDTFFFGDYKDEESYKLKINLTIEKYFDEAYDIYKKEDITNGVNYKLKGFCNLEQCYTKEQIKHMLFNIVSAIKDDNINMN